jgi:phage baseplate assembly protein gpV
MSDLEDRILAVVERWYASRYSERHGLVTSYDPNNYLAKVAFMPEGQESGWLPIETGHIGNSYGVAVGLQPGDGKKTGDQVVVRFQEGDVESGKIVQRVHSDSDTPPTVQSGELVLWTKFQNSGGGQDSAQGGQGGTGQKIYLKNDGSISFTDGNGATLTFDGLGNVTLQANQITVTAAKPVVVNAQDTLTVNGSKTITVNGTQNITVNGSAEVTVTAAAALDLNGSPINFNGGGPSTPPFTVPG